MKAREISALIRFKVPARQKNGNERAETLPMLGLILHSLATVEVISIGYARYRRDPWWENDFFLK